MKHELKLKDGSGFVEVESHDLVQMVREIIALPKPESGPKDWEEFRDQIEPLQIAFGIIKSYPEGYFASLDDSKAETLRSSFEGELLRLDQRPKTADGKLMLDVKGDPICTKNWYWGIDSKGKAVACGKIIRKSRDKVVFQAGETEYQIDGFSGFEWAICVPGN